jgi:hypothetical protein
MEASSAPCELVGGVRQLDPPAADMRSGGRGCPEMSVLPKLACVIGQGYARPLRQWIQTVPA